MNYTKKENLYILRIDKGEEIIESLKKFCASQKIYSGQISGIGATDNFEIGFFDTKKQKYYSKKFKGDHEITNINGNISTFKGECYLHLHATLADKEYKTKGGHLNSAIVSGTCEIYITVFEKKINRKFDKKSGLNIFVF